MRVKLELHLFIKVREGHVKTIGAVISPDLKGAMLVSWVDQIELDVMHENWPHVLPNKGCNINEDRCNGVRIEEEGTVTLS